MGCSGSKDSASKYVADDNFERVTRTSPPQKNSSSAQSGRPNLSQVSHIRPSAGKPGGANAASGSAQPAPAGSGSNPTGSGSRPGVSNYVPKKPPLDPKDFRFVGCRSQVLVKAPGTINGQAFTIDDCQDCDLYVLDACAQVNIDDCKNCRIFIGPCAGSIFLRSSSNVMCAFVTRQLRLRDVTQASISLLCRTQPILETSSEIQLGCFSLNYAALPGQLKASKLDVVHNFWWWPYDFTPKAGNWTYLPPDQDTEQVLGGALPEEVTQALGGTSKEGELVVTWGDRPDPPGECYLFALFAKEDAAHQYMNQAKHQGTVLSTNSLVCPDDVMDQLSSQAGWPRGAERVLLVPGPVWGVELRCSADVAKTLGGAVHMLGGQHTANTEVGEKFRKLGLEGSG